MVMDKSDLIICSTDVSFVSLPEVSDELVTKR